MINKKIDSSEKPKKVLPYFFASCPRGLEELLENPKGIAGLFEKIVEFIPPPEGEDTAPLKALIFDMKYNIYKGVMIYVRVLEGIIKPGVRIRMMNTKKEFGV